MRDDVARALATKALEVAQKAKSQQGPKGEKGDAGQIIVQPNKGDQGEQGPMGPQGIPGKSIVGPKGDKGDKGDPGLKGDKGDQGEAGKDGAQGERGERGFTGLKGAGGSQGPIGPMPKHEKKGLMIRFEKEPGTWGEWIIMPTGGGGGGRDDKLTDRQAELVALAEFYKTRGGNANKFVKTDGTNLVWADGDGVGDVTGPASSTDNAVALFDGTTGKVLKSGGVLATVATTGEYSDLSGLPTFGTIATQDANAVAITGGTIDNTSIGATTPSTVNATTITGQTGQLNGTGQNLVLQSQTLATSPWTAVSSGTTATNASTTAPDGTSTGCTLTANAGTGVHYAFSGALPAIPNSIPYTVSFYAKSGTTRYVQFAIGGTGTILANFDTTAGTVGTTLGLTSSSITAVGSGWYRCVVTFTYANTNGAGVVLAIQTSASDTRFQTWTAAGTETVLLWGIQAELGLTANTYIPTTTTAVYGTPTLSFSGVSSIGLLSNGALYLEPAGNGAIQADATTSTTAGGNVRGANAVDWQTLRSAAATRVASGAVATVSGGTNNSATAFGSVTCGGDSNQSTNTYSFIGAGAANAASAHYSSVVGGYTNSATGRYNFIGNGYANSGTANAAVTTQSATMNGTTAVTLSASNASIRVGQLITGTSITNFPDTYVAAISGTSLTLSQAASGSSTSTLSFFRPHGVVVGGGNNQATGSYSFIGGGGDAGTAANRNVASGDWSFVGGGLTNTASGLYSSTVAGRNSSATATDCHTLGASCVASSTAAIAIGFGSNSNGVSSAVLGASRGIARSIAGNTVFAGSNSPIASVSGVSQSALLVLGVQTTDATPTALCSNSSAAGTTNQVILPNNSAYFFRGEVISGKTGGGDAKGWTIEGVIKRGANAASTALVGVPTVTSTYADLGAATWDIAVTADTTNGGLRVTFTGQAATTIRTVCSIRTVEMTF
jgi:hypothetical protein